MNAKGLVLVLFEAAAESSLSPLRGHSRRYIYGVLPGFDKFCPGLKEIERSFDAYLEFKEGMSTRVCLILDSKRRVLCLVVTLVIVLMFMS